MSDENKKKFDFSKLKELGQMDLKDLKKLKIGNSKDSSKGVMSKLNVKIEKPRNVVSFDIGASAIKIASGKYHKGKLVINNCTEIVTPEGTIADGKILNENQLSEMLKFSLKDIKVKAADAIITTNSSLIINREIMIPKVEDEELDTVIRYEIQQYLPINLNDYVIQFIILDEVEAESGNKYKVNVIAYPDKISRDYYNLINSIGLNPYALDVTYNSLNKIANYSELAKENEECTVAFVDMGGTTTNIIILKNGKLDFTRMMRVGGENINFALAEELGMAAKSTEALKIEKSDLDDIKEDDFINIALKKVLGNISLEIERIFKFYLSKSVGNKIDKIYLYGGTSNIKGIEKYVEDKFNIPVKKIDKLNNVDFTSKELKELSMDRYLNAIGAIIRL